MASYQIHRADPPITDPAFEKYLILAADMARYDEDNETFNGHHWVVTSAQSEEDALELACSALEPGCVPIVAYTAAELHELANDLCARELAPGRSYNLTTEKTDEEVAESCKD